MDKHREFGDALASLSQRPNELFFWTLLLHMGSALSDLHDIEVVHRDVKLSNILFR